MLLAEHVQRLCYISMPSVAALLCLTVMSALHHFITLHCFYNHTMLCRAQSCYGKLSVYLSVCDVGVPSLYIIEFFEKKLHENQCNIFTAGW